MNFSLECFTAITAGIICNYLNELNAEHVINKMYFLHSPVTHGYPHVVADNLYEILKKMLMEMWSLIEWKLCLTG